MFEEPLQDYLTSLLRIQDFRDVCKHQHIFSTLKNHQRIRFYNNTFSEL